MKNMTNQDLLYSWAEIVIVRGGGTIYSMSSLELVALIPTGICNKKYIKYVLLINCDLGSTINYELCGKIHKHQIPSIWLLFDLF